ncbi:MAG TPA: bifunctional nicotinamidase/pyrazinamidase [Deltaproteobacteria bacterium]|nr:bifunctional nicotinamidase/pyrazinamidase [Deltaproteobacteria bacterium]
MLDLDDLSWEKSVVLSRGDALLVVDMQNDFMPKGALAVDHGDMILPGVNALMSVFSVSGNPVILTQDWHPANHRSFASVHGDRNPFDPVDTPGIGPVLWPDHCVQGTHGADFHQDLDTSLARAVIRKGTNPLVDSYSGFLENDRDTPTGLHGYLKNIGVTRIFVCGLALDYCVFFTAADGADLGYEVWFLADLTKPVASPEGSVSRALETLRGKGVRFLRAEAVKQESG